MQGSAVINTVELAPTHKKINNEANAIKIASALSEVKSKGYKLISSSGIGGDFQSITTYIFEK